MTYRLVYHDVARKQVQTCASQLSLAGWDLHAMTEKLAKMELGLKRSPLDYGEALYQLRPLGLVIAIVCVRPLAFHVGVHEETRTVFIREATLMTLGDT